MGFEKRIAFLGLFLFLGVAVLVGAILFAPNTKSVRPRASVLLIVSDALRWDSLSCYGSANQTPNIDRLARAGALFEQAHSTAGWTLPSATSIFTGKFPDTCELDPKKAQLEKLKKGGAKTPKRAKHICYVSKAETLLAEVLAQEGYDTRFDIENPIIRHSNILQGFSPWKGSRRMSDKTKSRLEAAAGKPFVSSLPDPIQDQWPKEYRPSREKGYRYQSSEGRSFKILDALMRQGKGQPFFFLKWFSDPHSGYNPPARLTGNLSVTEQNLPRSPISYRFSEGITKFSEKNLTPYERQHVRALYDGEVRLIDELVGYLWAALKERGLLERTYVIFTSDHGERFGEGGRWSHGPSLEETLVRVPLIFIGPDIQAGQRITTPVSLVDLMPTLKELLDVEYDDEMQGKSFAGLLHGRAREPDPVYFYAWSLSGARLGAAKLGKWKAYFERSRNEKASYRLLDLDSAHWVTSTEDPLVKKLLAAWADVQEESKALHELNRQRLENEGYVAPDEQDLENELRALGYIE